MIFPFLKNEPLVPFADSGTEEQHNIFISKEGVNKNQIKWLYIAITFFH
jgi:hypothetical protein